MYKLREREAASSKAKARSQPAPSTPRIARVIEAREVDSAGRRHPVYMVARHHLSVSFAVGFISLFGVAVMSGRAGGLGDQSPTASGRISTHDAVVQGALSQLRPVLMMIVVALLGMVPAARATGIRA